jgi:hypothetical protein
VLIVIVVVVMDGEDGRYGREKNDVHHASADTVDTSSLYLVHHSPGVGWRL